MSVSPVTYSSKSAKDAPPANTGGTSSDDLYNNFMTLLVAQMQNQDPTNPMDNNQLTTQLAQFNTAAGVQQLNSTMNSVGTLISSMQQMNAAEWVGREVLVEGTETVSNETDGNKGFGFSVNSDTDKVTVTLTDDAGNAYTAELKDVKAGVHQYTMDDLTNFQPSDPTEVEGGKFKVSFSASNESGEAPDVVALKKVKVDSVSFTQQGAVLQFGIDGSATLGEVYLIE
ncbi:flagellar basal body rod modification protein FlgD [Leclercia adecarboxylata]|nr:flagellar basal body rod modification protein FlgD [Leclercia adecarboxylata]KMN61731.1 flagellar basal body rod modification protein FlgD [Leclercia sp. LK8]